MADVVDATPGVVETAPDAGAEHKYVFNVSMSCGGCSGAVDRVLKKLEGTVSPFPVLHHLPSAPVLTWLCLLTGVKSYEVSLDTQTATVVAEESLPYSKVLKTIAKTGKKVNSGEADGVAQSVEVPAE